MAKNMVTYIANLGKSVSYSAIDKVKSMSPVTASFAETNSEMFKDVYSLSKNYRTTIRRAGISIKKTKIYEAADVGIKSIFEDISTGNLYNRERIAKMEVKAAGSLMEGLDGGVSSDLDLGSGFDLGPDFDNWDINDGDAYVADTMDRVGQKTTKSITTTLAKTSQYIAETSNANTKLIYTQQGVAFEQMTSSLGAINKNLSYIMEVANSVQVHTKNSQTFYETITSMDKERNDLLKELVGMQRSLNQTTQQASNSNKKKITYSDMVDSEGSPDLGMYVENVKRNIRAMDGGLGGMLQAFDGGNILLTFASSPLKMVTDKLVGKMMPKIVEESTKQFNESLRGFFGSLMLKMNTMAKGENPLLSKIGQILGIKSSISDSIDTAAYVKGPVPFDGKTRKSIIEVIPTYLSKILSAITGTSELIMDFDKGKFIHASSVKDEFKSMRDRGGQVAGSDMKEEFNKYIALISFKNKKDKEELEHDIGKFFDTLYKNGEMFDYNNEDEFDYSKYGISSGSYRTIKTMFKKSPRWKQQQLNANILNERDKYRKHIDRLQEQGDSVYNTLNNGFNANEFLEVDKKGNIKGTKGKGILSSGGLMKSEDNLGHTMFYYMQNIYKELMFMRQVGMGRYSGNLAYNGTTITSASGTTLTMNAIRNVDDMKIKNDHIKTDEERSVDSERSSMASFERKAVEARQKNKKLLHAEKLDSMDDKEFEATFGARIEVNKIEQEAKNNDQKLGVIDKLLRANSLSAKANVIIDNVNELAKKPAKFLASVIDKADQRLYQIIYGKPGDKSTKGFMTELLYRLQNTFGKFNDWMDETIFQPIKDKLGVKNMKDVAKKLIGNIFGVDPDEMAKSFRTYLFGEKNEETKKREGGLFGDIIQGVKDSFGDAFGWIKNAFKDVFGPTFNKLKERFKGKAKSDEIVDKDGNLIKTDKSSVEKYIQSISTGRTAKQSKNDMIYALNNQDPYTTKKIIDAQLGGISIDDYINNQSTSLLPIINGGAKNKKQYKDARGQLRGLNKLKEDYLKANGIITEKETNKKYDTYTESIKHILGLTDDDELSKQLVSTLRNTRGSVKNVDQLNMKDLYETSLGLEKNDPAFRKITDNISNMMDSIYQNVNKSINEVIEDSVSRQLDTMSNEKPLARNAEISKNLGIKDYTPMTPDEISNQYGLFDHITNSIEDLNKDNSKENTKLEDILSSISKTATKILDVIKSKLGVQGHNIVDTFGMNDMPGHANGVPVVKKTGVAVLSEGEMVIPSEMNPFYNGKDSKKQQMSKENKARRNFLKSIPGFFEGTAVVDDKTMKDPKSKGLNMDFYRNVKDGNVSADSNDGLAMAIGKEFVGGIHAVKKQLLGESSKQNREKFANAVEDVTGKISQYAPPAIAGSLMGAGVSLVTGAIGGPLLGAAAGAGISLIKNSDKVRSWLFGDKDEDDNYKGGVISKDISNNIKKYFPDMAKFGAVGSILHLLPFIPGGPVAGLIVGSAVGFAKNNDKVQQSLFGGEDGEGGLISNKFKEQVEQALPRMGAGAVAGLLMGPFGLVGNMVLGSAIGFASTTDSFKDVVFGKEGKDGERSGGLLTAIRTFVIDPLKQFATDSKDKFFGWIEKNILEPLKSAFDPIKKEMQLAIKGMFNMVGTAINKMFENALGIPLNKFIEDKIIKPFTSVFSKVFKALLSPTKFIVSAPFKAIGGVGNYLRMKQISKGQADYMTARERLDFRKKRKKSLNSMFGDKFVEFDKVLSEMNPEDIDEMMQDLSYLKDTTKKVGKDIKESMNTMGSKVAQNFSYDDSKKLMKLIRDQKFSHVGRFVRNSDLKDDDKNGLLDFIEQEGTNYVGAVNAKNDTGKFKNDLYSKLAKKGFKNINDNNVGDYISLLQKESKSRQPIDPTVEIEQKNHTEIVDIMNNIVSEVKKINDPKFQAENKDAIDSKISKKMKKQKKFTYNALGEPMKLTIDRNGDEILDSSDADTNKVVKDQDDRDNTQKGILKKLGALDSLKKLFGMDDKDKDNKKEKSLLEKVMDFTALGSIIVTGIAAAMNGEFTKLKDYIGKLLGYNSDDNSGGIHSKKTFNKKLKMGAAMYSLRGHSYANLIKKVPIVGKHLEPLGKIVDTPARLLAKTKAGQLIMGDRAASKLLGEEVKNPLTRMMENRATSISNTVIGTGITKGVAKSADKMVNNAVKDANKELLDQIAKGTIQSSSDLGLLAKTQSEAIYTKAFNAATAKGLSAETAQEIATLAKNKSLKNIEEHFAKKGPGIIDKALMKSSGKSFMRSILKRTSTSAVVASGGKSADILVRNSANKAWDNSLKLFKNRSSLKTVSATAKNYANQAYKEAFKAASKNMGEAEAKQYAIRAAQETSAKIMAMGNINPSKSKVILEATKDAVLESIGIVKGKLIGVSNLVKNGISPLTNAISSKATAVTDNLGRLIRTGKTDAKVLGIMAKDTITSPITRFTESLAADEAKALTQRELAKNLLAKNAEKGIKSKFIDKTIANGTGWAIKDTISGAVNAVKGKMLNISPVKNIATKVTERIGTNAAVKAGEKGAMNSVIRMITRGFEKLLASKIVVKYLGKKGVAVVGGKFLRSILEFVTKKFATTAGKLLAKMSATAVSLGLANVAFATYGFINSFTDANEVFKIEQEATLPQKVCAGLIGALNQGVLYGIVPEDILVDLVLKYVAPVLGIKNTQIQKERAKTEINLEAFNMKAYNKSRNKKSISKKQLQLINLKAYNDRMSKKDPDFEPLTLDKYKKIKDKNAMTMNEYLAGQYKNIETINNMSQEELDAKNLKAYNDRMSKKDPSFKPLTLAQYKSVKDKNAITRYKAKSMDEYLQTKGYGGSLGARLGDRISNMGKGINNFFADPMAGFKAMGERLGSIGKVIKDGAIGVIKAVLGPVKDVIDLATGVKKGDYWNVRSGKKGMFAGLGEFLTLSERILLFPVYLIVKAGADIWNKVKDNPAVKGMLSAGSYVFSLVKYNIELALNGKKDIDIDLAKKVNISDNDPNAGMKKVLFYGTNALMLPLFLGLKVFSKIEPFIGPFVSKIGDAAKGLFDGIINVGSFAMKDATNVADLLIKGELSMKTFSKFYRKPKTDKKFGGLKTSFFVITRIMGTIPFTVGMLLRQVPSMVSPIFNKIKDMALFVGDIIKDSEKMASSGITQGWGKWFKCPKKYDGLSKVMFYTTRILLTPAMAVMKLFGIGKFLIDLKDKFVNKVIKPFVDFFGLGDYFNIDKLSKDQESNKSKVKKKIQKSTSGAYSSTEDMNKAKYNVYKSMTGKKTSYKEFSSKNGKKTGNEVNELFANQVLNISGNEYSKNKKKYDSQINKTIANMKLANLPMTKAGYEQYKKMNTKQIANATIVNKTIYSAKTNAKTTNTLYKDEYNLQDSFNKDMGVYSGYTFEQNLSRHDGNIKDASEEIYSGLASTLLGLSYSTYQKNKKKYNTKIDEIVATMKKLKIPITKKGYAKYKKMSKTQVQQALIGKSGKGSGLVSDFISQLDPSVSNLGYNNATDNIKQTIGDSGCAPASAAMTINSLSNKSLTLQDAAKYALDKKYKDKNSGTEAGYFKDIFSKYGYQSNYTNKLDKPALSNIASGSPVVLMGVNKGTGGKTISPFGPNPHYVVAKGMSNDGEYMYVNDPEAKKGGIRYKTSQIIKNTKLAITPSSGKGSGLYSRYVGFGGSASEIATQDLGSFSDLSEQEMNDWIASQAPAGSPFKGNASIFLEASKASGLDPRYILAHAAIESAWGTSNICRAKGNYFGIGAYNSSPTTSAYTFSVGNMRASIVDGAKWIRKNYYNKGQKSLQTMLKPGHCYAVYNDGRPNIEWMQSISSVMATAPGNTNTKYIHSSDLNLNISSSATNTAEALTGFESILGAAFDNKESIYGSLLTGFLGNSSDSSSTTASTANTTSKTVTTPSKSGSTAANKWFDKNLNATVSSNYGMRVHPIKGVSKFHDGIDYAAKKGTAIPTPISGVVVRNEYEGGGAGNYVQIKDSKGYISTFMHMENKSKLSVGSKVKMGDVLGYVGSTGASTGPHLHYRVHDPKGNKMNPNDYFKVIGKGSGLVKNPNLDFYTTAKETSNRKNDVMANTLKKMSTGGPIENNRVKLNLGSTQGNSNAVDLLNSKRAIDNNETNKLIKALIRLVTKIATNSDQLASIVKLLTEYFTEQPKQNVGKSNNATNINKNNKLQKAQQLVSNYNNVSNKSSDMEQLINELAGIATD